MCNGENLQTGKWDELAGAQEQARTTEQLDEPIRVGVQRRASGSRCEGLWLHCLKHTHLFLNGKEA